MNDTNGGETDMFKHICLYKILIVMGLVVVFGAIGALGKETIEIFSNKTEIKKQVNLQENAMLDNDNLKANEKALKKVVLMEDTSTPINYDRYQNILSYSIFLAENEFTKEQLEYLNKLIDSGYSEGIIQEVYEFWKTTDEDFSMIGKLCEKSNELYGINWVENAFNNITSNSHGVLSREDIQEYYEKGLTYDDIYAANILSRRKGKTIQEILNDILSGTANSEIINDSRVVTEARIEKSKINNVNLNLALRMSENKYLENENIPSDEHEIDHYLVEIEDARYEQKINEAKQKLMEMGVVPEKIDIAAKSKKDNELKRKAQENGFDIYMISSLKRRGYTYSQIEEGSRICLEKDIDPLHAVKIAAKETR